MVTSLTYTLLISKMVLNELIWWIKISFRQWIDLINTVSIISVTHTLQLCFSFPCSILPLCPANLYEHIGTRFWRVPGWSQRCTHVPGHIAAQGNCSRFVLATLCAKFCRTCDQSPTMTFLPSPCKSYPFPTSNCIFPLWSSALVFFMCKMSFLFFMSRGKFDKCQPFRLLQLDQRTEWSRSRLGRWGIGCCRFLRMKLNRSFWESFPIFTCSSQFGPEFSLRFCCLVFWSTCDRRCRGARLQRSRFILLLGGSWVRRERLWGPYGREGRFQRHEAVRVTHRLLHSDRLLQWVSWLFCRVKSSRTGGKTFGVWWIYNVSEVKLQELKKKRDKMSK